MPQRQQVRKVIHYYCHWGYLRDAEQHLSYIFTRFETKKNWQDLCSCFSIFWAEKQELPNLFFMDVHNHVTNHFVFDWLVLDHLQKAEQSG